MYRFSKYYNHAKNTKMSCVSFLENSFSESVQNISKATFENCFDCLRREMEIIVIEKLSEASSEAHIDCEKDEFKRLSLASLVSVCVEIIHDNGESRLQCQATSLSSICDFAKEVITSKVLDSVSQKQNWISKQGKEELVTLFEYHQTRIQKCALIKDYSGISAFANVHGKHFPGDCLMFLEALTLTSSKDGICFCTRGHLLCGKTNDPNKKKYLPTKLSVYGVTDNMIAIRNEVTQSSNFYEKHYINAKTRAFKKLKHPIAEIMLILNPNARIQKSGSFAHMVKQILYHKDQVLNKTMQDAKELYSSLANFIYLQTGKTCHLSAPNLFAQQFPIAYLNLVAEGISGDELDNVFRKFSHSV